MLWFACSLLLQGLDVESLASTAAGLGGDGGRPWVNGTCPQQG